MADGGRYLPVHGSPRRINEYLYAHWGLDDPSSVEGTADERLAAFRRTQRDVAIRLRPFVDVALHAAGRRPASVING